MEKILVTAKVNPDLDGTACMLAYADLLSRTGQPAEGIPFGNLAVATEYFVTNHHISIPTRPDDGTGNWTKFILVDASSTTGVPRVVRKSDIIEFIDHREGEPQKDLPHAKIQNELIGAVATLIVERFEYANLFPTADHAKLLYGAIFENTLDLSSSNTDKRDHNAVKFLEDNFALTRDIISEMYIYSTSKILENIDKPLLEDSKVFTSPTGSYVVCQLVIWGSDLRTQESKIKKILLDLQTKSNSKFTFLTSVNLKQKQNLFYAPSSQAKSILEKSLGAKFAGDWGTLSPMLLRKQIFPKINAVLK